MIDNGALICHKVCYSKNKYFHGNKVPYVGNLADTMFVNCVGTAMKLKAVV